MENVTILLRAVLIEGLFVEFSRYVLRTISCISTFSFFFSKILEREEAFQIFCPSLNFQTLEVFPVLLGDKKKEENLEKIVVR